MANIVERISKKLRNLRAGKKYSQGQVAYMLGISQPAYNKIETGLTQVSLIHLERLARLYGVSMRYFFDDEEGHEVLYVAIGQSRGHEKIVNQ